MLCVLSKGVVVKGVSRQPHYACTCPGACTCHVVWDIEDCKVVELRLPDYCDFVVLELLLVTVASPIF